GGGGTGHVKAVAVEGLVLQQGEPRAHARAARHRRSEAHPVQPVVDAHLAVRERKSDLRKVRQERQREEAVGDGAAEARALRARRIDVDPLKVLDRLGEGIDALLAYVEPGRYRDLLAHAVPQLPDRRHFLRFSRKALIASFASGEARRSRKIRVSSVMASASKRP